MDILERSLAIADKIFAELSHEEFAAEYNSTPEGTGPNISQFLADNDSTDLHNDHVVFVEMTKQLKVVRTVQMDFSLMLSMSNCVQQDDYCELDSAA